MTGDQIKGWNRMISKREAARRDAKIFERFMQGTSIKDLCLEYWTRLADWREREACEAIIRKHCKRNLKTRKPRRKKP